MDYERLTSTRDAWGFTIARATNNDRGMPGLGRLRGLVPLCGPEISEPAGFTPQADAVGAACASIEASGMVLLGEIHGVRQTPSQIARLVELLDIRTIAFEWHSELVPTVERFRTGGPLDDHPLLWLGDGRITVGHLALLRRLHIERPALRWLAFDDWSAPPQQLGESQWAARDRRMATRVLDAVETTDRALVVAGNLHTALTEVDAGTPMGAWIARERPGVRTISIRYGRGRYYNLGSRTRHALRSPASARLHLKDGSLTLDEPRPEEAYVPHRPLEELGDVLPGV